MMDKTVKMYLIWEERTDVSGACRIREFPSLGILNEFMKTLREDNVKSIKVISGIELERREC